MFDDREVTIIAAAIAIIAILVLMGAPV